MTFLDETLGAYLIGLVVASILYGCTVVQTWYYYTHYPSDPWYNKLLVATVLVSDTVHQGLITQLIYTYLVTYFGDFEKLNNIILSLVIEILFNGSTALVVQSFLAMRVYKLSNKNLFVTSLVMTSVLLEWTLILVFCIKTSHIKTYAALSSTNNLGMAIFAAGAAADVLITICLCYLLQKSRTGFRRSDVTINKLIMFSINTGLLTSLNAIASLISIIVRPQSFICIAFFFTIGRLYCNSLLATLNVRKGLTKGDTQLEDISSQGTQQKRPYSFLGRTSKRATNNISIKIDTTQEYTRDEQHLSSSSAELKNPEVI